jgi:hypothetical protein
MVAREPSQLPGAMALEERATICPQIAGRSAALTNSDGKERISAFWRQSSTAWSRRAASTTRDPLDFLI